MNEKEREEVALFRFGVISELVCTRLESGALTELIREKSRQRWHIPGSGRTRVSASTIRRWVRLYENSDRQLVALYPTPRSDRGRSRRVDEETILSLIKLRKELPGLPVARLIEELAKRNLCLFRPEAFFGNRLPDPQAGGDFAQEDRGEDGPPPL